MFRRFLNNNDYKGLISLETLDQMVRGDYEKLEKGELNAEMSLLEYLSENYEIEKELAEGKYIVEYDRRITFPIGAYFYIGEDIFEVTRSISGYQKPSIVEYWEEYICQLGQLDTKASKLRINPQIPRKLDREDLPVTDWQMATFQTRFDPYENPWLT